MNFKSGFVTILGKPNVGKSTLLNKLLRQKVSIVSPKAQTTRNKITGILNGKNYQIVFTDTPGIHKTKNELDAYMQKSIDVAKKDVDIILYLLDATKKLDNEELKEIENYAKHSKLILAINKTDDIKYEKLFEYLAKLNAIEDVKEILPISAVKGTNLDELLNVLLKHLDEGPKYFDDSQITDVSEKFLASEIIREKALWLIQEEIPHGIAVQIDIFHEEENLNKISATIFVEKESHKKIVIGNAGSMLKKIGEAARKEIEHVMGKKAFLELWVKVKQNWRDSDILVNNLGYNKKELDN